MLHKGKLHKKKKEKIKKRRSNKKPWFVVVILFLVITGGILFYYFFFNNNALFISPIAITKFKESIKLENALRDSSIKYIKITPQSDLSFMVELIDKEEVIFSSKKDIQSQIASLQLITKRLTIEGKRFKRLDFRYDKPLIAF